MILHIRLAEREAETTIVVCGELYKLDSNSHTSIWYRGTTSIAEELEFWSEFPLIVHVTVCEECVNNPRIDLAILGDVTL